MLALFDASKIYYAQNYASISSWCLHVKHNIILPLSHNYSNRAIIYGCALPVEVVSAMPPSEKRFGKSLGKVAA